MTGQQRMGLFGVPGAVIVIVTMLIVPMPTFVLDLLITVNISAALIVLLTTMHVKHARDFSAFPSLLLVATMFRLAINVSVTRLVLLHANAGTVVQSFGSFVIGGQIVVGLVIFLILIIIQFVVVTSGAGRVSEVAARFSLDAMAPKMMAIDGELNTGLIDEREARRRRKEIDETSEFYGTMDGASKFVRGDAVAALVITFVNLVGGFAIGVLQSHLSMSQAIHTYSVLSVGDGLVSQIPALLLSISSGIIVTRGTTEDEDFGTDVVRQIMGQPKAFQIAGIAMLFLGLIPGLPHIPFMIVGAVLLLVSGRAARSGSEAAGAEVEAEAPPDPAEADTPQHLATEIRLDRLELELAPDLTSLADPTRGGDLLDRVRGLRRKIAFEKGFAMPTVRTRDNLNLPLSTYAVKVNGVEVARGQAPPGRMLAIGTGLDSLPGERTVEPVFGLPAKWIPAEAREQAIAAVGITPIDRSSALITHLAEIVSTHAADLLSAQQVQVLLDSIRSTDPAVVEEMKAAQVTLTDVHQVLCSLLREGVPILDLVRIVESVIERSRQPNRTAQALVDAARVAVGPMISAAHMVDGVLPVVTVDAALEQVLVNGVRVTESGPVLAVEPSVTEHLVNSVRRLYDEAGRSGRFPVLVVGSALRQAVAPLFAAALPRLAVMSINEIGRQVQLQRMGVVSGADATIGV